MLFRSTKHLAGAAKQCIAVEIDGRVVEELRRQFESPGFSVLHKDFLAVMLSDLRISTGDKLKLVGNIPYHLTSPILFKIFAERSAVRNCTVMIQKEVARRIVAKPNSKEYGILSVFTQFYGIPKILFTVSPNCFYPKPNVTSAVIQIEMREKLMFPVDEQIFATIVKTTFGKRRKTLRNSLAYLPFDESVVKRMIPLLDFPLDKRPEQLSLEQFAQLTNQVTDVIS